MLELAKALSRENAGQDGADGLVQAVLGYRDSFLFLKDEFAAYGSVYAATEDGSAGTREMCWMPSARMAWTPR